MPTELNQPADIYARIYTYGDGNCGLNAVALKLFELSKQNQLQRAFNEAEFKIFRTHLLASVEKLNEENLKEPKPYIGGFIELLESKKLTLNNLQQYLAKANSRDELRQLQQVIAPALRSYLISLFVPYSLRPENFSTFRNNVLAILKKNEWLKEDYPCLENFHQLLAAQDHTAASGQTKAYIEKLDAVELAEFFNAMTTVMLLGDINDKVADTLLRGRILAKEATHVDDEELGLIARKLHMGLSLEEKDQPETLRNLHQNEADLIPLHVMHSSSSIGNKDGKAYIAKDGHWSLGVSTSDEPAKKIWDNIENIYADAEHAEIDLEQQERINTVTAIIQSQHSQLLKKVENQLNNLMSDMIDELDKPQYIAESADIVGGALKKLEDVYQIIANEIDLFINNLLASVSVLTALDDAAVNEQIEHLYQQSIVKHRSYMDDKPKAAGRIITTLRSEINKTASAAHSSYSLYPEKKPGKKPEIQKERVTEQSSETSQVSTLKN